MLIKEIEGLEFHFHSWHEPKEEDAYMFGISFSAVNATAEPFRVIAHSIKIWDGNDELISSDHQRVPTDQQELKPSETVELDIECELTYPYGTVQFYFDIQSNGSVISLQSQVYTMKATAFFH